MVTPPVAGRAQGPDTPPFEQVPWRRPGGAGARASG